MNFRDAIKNHFSFTLREQRGIFALSVCIMVVTVVRISLPWISGYPTVDYAAFNKKIQLLQAIVSDTTSIQDTASPDPSARVKFLSYSDQVRHIPAGQTTAKSNAPSIRKIELNSADSLDLVRLKGIGPVLSARIIKYREALGGFYDTDQLKEVYGIDSVTFRMILPHLSVDPSSLKKLPLNAASFRELLHHPYLDYEEVKRIMQFRDKNGPFKSPDMLYELNGLDSNRIMRLLPYLYILSEGE